VAADTRAGVHTVLVDAGQVPGALGIDYTLRLTLNVRVANIVPDAGATGCISHLPAVGIDPTGRRVARLYHDRLDNLWFKITSSEGVPDIALVADTDGHMVSDPAVGIDATQVGAGVLTVHVDAGQLCGAVIVDGTLWPAVGRASDHARHARALTGATNIPWWQAVGSAGVGLAGVRLDWLQWRGWRSSTANKRIPNVALVADADGQVVGHLAVGIAATQAGAGVDTVQVPALSVGRAVGIDDALRSAGHVWISKVVRDAATGTGSVP
jgi:hypothetical protein